MNAEERKKRVLKSRAFQTWWEARQDVEPVPSNPYRAYMIDLSLNAIVDRRDTWEKLPNRRDEPDVDLPERSGHGVPTYAPSRKPRRRREAPYKSEAVPKSGLARDVYLSNAEMAASHGLPAPRVVTKKQSSPLTSSARVGVGRIQGEDRILTFGHQGEINVGTKGRRAVVLATAAHETGHVVHAQSLAKGKTLKGVTPFKGIPSSMSDELMATKLARQHLKKSKAVSKKGELATGSWFLKYALDTYRKGWKTRGKPVKIGKQGTLISGGELTKRKRKGGKKK